MEKFKKFGDTSTGINPFTVVVPPTKLGFFLASLMFPMRLVFCSLLSLLLLVVDTIAYLLYVLYLALLAKILIAPLQRLLVRALLFFMGHVCPCRQAAPPGALLKGGGPSRICAGELVVCTCQSALDTMVLEVVLKQPFVAVAVPWPSASAEGGSSAAATTVKVMWPSPWQRWAVWRAVRQTGSIAYLQACVKKHHTSSSSSSAIDVLPVQQKAARCGVPVLYYGEATCSNGKGVLPMRDMTCASNAASVKDSKNAKRGDDGAAVAAATSASSALVLHVAFIDYDTPAVQSVLSDGEGCLGYLFRVSKLIYGSTDANWTSPFFPTAAVTHQTVTVGDVPRVAVSGGVKDGKLGWQVGQADMLTLRQAMCGRGSGAAASSRRVRRQPVSVGLQEKLGYAETCAATRSK